MLKIYRIKFLSPSSQIRAFTLFGAFCWAYRLLGGDVEEFCEEFKENPKFIISSPFPLIKVESSEQEIKEIPLLPKPVMPVLEEFERSPDICKKIERKTIKETQYLTFKAFRKLVFQTNLEEKLFFSEDFIKVKEIKVGCLKSNREEGEKREKKKNFKFIYLKGENINRICHLDESDISVRNVLNRITMKSDNLFTEHFYLFSDRYFVVKFFDESLKDMFETCLRIIEDMGLGANKNIGWGKVKIEDITEEVNLKEFKEFIEERLNKKSERFITLSPVLPEKEKTDLEGSYYQIETYKAPVDTTFGWEFLWKKKVIYLKEGSILKKKNEQFAGTLKDVGGEKEGKRIKVFQYGFEFPVYI